MALKKTANKFLYTGVGLSLIFVFFIALRILFALYQSQPVAKVNGVALSEAMPIADFVLQDQHGQPFTQADLLGKWHIVAAGYTHCADICPMTLLALSQFQRYLAQSEFENDVDIIFYTVDPRRDTTQVLTDYLAFFAPEIIGLRQIEGLTYLGFVNSLNIIAIYEYAATNDNYSVSHSVAFMVINPKGQLQAILKPETNHFGEVTLSSKLLFEDFKQIRQYYDDAKGS
ncbi:SCO family protein [Moritella yayanosii]|uniref:Putative SCO1/SenC family protein (Copper-binding protein) n=1 Tax=Moritella yayanosii TaxID=69539 RepID=A0A330LM00_9GAMM|nr:SCO family protein [Moritella yayanosii]SQD77669.1 putative SCO1/SenC family protein (Copper-binding protein) [Moritella yayanosii]